MATSTVKLYSVKQSQKWELIQERLLVIDRIEDYLAKFNDYAKTINDFQYIKPELEIAITIDISQTYASPLMPSYKYVSIKNSDDLESSQQKTYYYYVKKVVWRSKSSVRLELVMDVLNTFREEVDYKFKPNTKITREHKDRYTASTSIEVKLASYSDAVGTFINGDKMVLTSDENDKVIFTGTFLDFDEVDGDFYLTMQLNGRVEYRDLELWQFVLSDDRESPKMTSVDGTKSFVFTMAEEVGSANYSIYRKIDSVAEGINPVLQCQNANGQLIEHPTSLLAQNWYLLYRNEKNPLDESELVNPVECYLIPEDITDIYDGVVSNGRIMPDSLNANVYYYGRLPVGVTMTLSNGQSFNTARAFLITKQDNNKISITFAGANALSSIMTYLSSYDDIDYISFSAFPIPYEPKNAQISTADWFSLFGNESEEWDDQYEGDIIDGINAVDRTDVKNIKLIKIPYCPYNFTVSGGKLQVAGTDWFYTTITQANSTTLKVIKLNDLNIKLHGSFNKTGNNYSPYHNFKYDAPSDASINDLRRDYTYESKLFHSEFYRPTYVYDSFTFVMQLEKLDESYYVNSAHRQLSLKFTMSSTINSKFMFTYKNYDLKYAEENYAKYMVIARNNEEVLYNIPYINYVRSGFNYEKKQKALSTTSNIVGTVLSGLAIGASLLLPSSPLKIAGVVATITNFANSIKNTVVSAVKGEEDIKQKLIEKKQESASVEGSDDVDLMSEYASNRIKYLEYEPREMMRNIIFDLFYYAGYNSGRMGIPNHNTRLNFDYLECEPVFEKIANIPNDIMEQLTNCFRSGVTYIHKTPRSSKEWDILQEFENWERIFFVYL